MILAVFKFEETSRVLLEYAYLCYSIEPCLIALVLGDVIIYPSAENVFVLGFVHTQQSHLYDNKQLKTYLSILSSFSCFMM